MLVFFVFSFIDLDFFIQYLLDWAVILTFLLIHWFLFFDKIQVSLFIFRQILSTLKFECSCASTSIEFKVVCFPVDFGVMFFQLQYSQYDLMISHINYVESDVLTVLLDLY